MRQLLHDCTAPLLDDFFDRIDRDGFAIVDQVISSDEIQRLIDILSQFPIDDSSSRRRRETQFARRNLLEVDEVRELAHLPRIISLIGEVLGQYPVPVRSILFDKTAAANWVVPWHQDLSIAVKHRVDVHGYGPWSTKAGVVHVQPPVQVLKKMLTIRLHLDDCDEDNGPLRIIPGSHLSQLSPAELEQRVNTGPIVACTVRASGVVIMRPTLVHGSSPARKPSNRRVIHIEYAACELPGGLEWHAA